MIYASDIIESLLRIDGDCLKKMPVKLFITNDPPEALDIRFQKVECVGERSLVIHCTVNDDDPEPYWDEPAVTFQQIADENPGEVVIDDQGQVVLTTEEREAPAVADTSSMAYALAHIANDIDTFDEECGLAEYTDTDRVWDLLNAFRNIAREAVAGKAEQPVNADLLAACKVAMSEMEGACDWYGEGPYPGNDKAFEVVQAAIDKAEGGPDGKEETETPKA